jgi:hypothetical protein
MFYTPLMSIQKFAVLSIEGLTGAFCAVRDAFKLFKSLVLPVAYSKQNREATMGFLQLCQQIGQ